MDCSMPGLPVHHQLPEFTQTHVHWVGDAIQPSHPLSSPSPPTFNPSQHQGLFNESALRISWPKYWSFSFSISPSKDYSGLISFRILVWSPCSPRDSQESFPAPEFEWSIPKSDWLYSFQLKMEKLYTVSKSKTGSGPWFRSWAPYWKIPAKLSPIICALDCCCTDIWQPWPSYTLPSVVELSLVFDTPKCRYKLSPSIFLLLLLLFSH